MNTQKRKTILTEQAALEKVRKYCAFQERCQQEVRNKLYEYGLYSQLVEGIIAHLIAEGFINEERFATIFAGGKFRIKKWGKQKIMLELQKRKISDYCINKAIDEDDYDKTLEKTILKKAKEIDEKDKFILKNKLAKYAISKGFESEMVWQFLNKKYNQR